MCHLTIEISCNPPIPLAKYPFFSYPTSPPPLFTDIFIPFSLYLRPSLPHSLSTTFLSDMIRLEHLPKFDTSVV